MIVLSNFFKSIELLITLTLFYICIDLNGVVECLKMGCPYHHFVLLFPLVSIFFQEVFPILSVVCVYGQSCLCLWTLQLLSFDFCCTWAFLVLIVHLLSFKVSQWWRCNSPLFGSLCFISLSLSLFLALCLCPYTLKKKGCMRRDRVIQRTVLIWRTLFGRQGFFLETFSSK